MDIVDLNADFNHLAALLLCENMNTASDRAGNNTLFNHNRDIWEPYNVALSVLSRSWYLWKPVHLLRPGKRGVGITLRERNKCNVKLSAVLYNSPLLFIQGMIRFLNPLMGACKC